MRYSGFKKVHEDGEKAILKHKNGSELKIAKHTLSAQHLDSLKKLPLYKAEAGYINNPDEEPTPQPAPMPTQAPVTINIAPSAPQPAPVAQQQPAPVPQATPGPNAEVPQPQQTLAPVPEPMPEQSQGASAEPQPVVDEQPQAPQRQITQAAPPPDPKAIEMQQYVATDQAFTNDLNNGHIKPKTYSDLFADKSTIGKIGTLFGLLVSGAGSGLSHQPNAVLEMMNQEIKRDLEGQIKSKENALNYLRVNQAQQAQKSLIRATEAGAKLNEAEAGQKAFALSQMQMNRAALHSLVQQNQKLPPGSPARKAGDQMLAMMFQAINNENFSIADRAAAAQSLLGMGESGSDYAQQSKALEMSGNEKLRDYQDKRYVPGFGHASIEVPGDVRQDLIAKREYDQAARNYIAFAKKHQANWANLNPAQRLAIARQGGVMGKELAGKYRIKTKGGVYKEGEKEYIAGIIPENAVSWQASFNQIPKIEQTLENNSADINNIAKSYEFKGANSKPSQGEKQPAQSADTIERYDPKSKRTVIYDSKTKKPLRFK